MRSRQRCTATGDCKTSTGLFFRFPTLFEINSPFDAVRYEVCRCVSTLIARARVGTARSAVSARFRRTKNIIQRLPRASFTLTCFVRRRMFGKGSRFCPNRLLLQVWVVLPKKTDVIYITCRCRSPFKYNLLTCYVIMRGGISFIMSLRRCIACCARNMFYLVKRTSTRMKTKCAISKTSSSIRRNTHVCLLVLLHINLSNTSLFCSIFNCRSEARLKKWRMNVN